MNPSRIHAPAFPGDLEWIGTDASMAPPSLSRMRGNIVVLHFWTFC